MKNQGKIRAVRGKDAFSGEVSFRWRPWKGCFPKSGRQRFPSTAFTYFHPKKRGVPGTAGDTARTELCSSCGNKDCHNRKTAICEKEREDVGMKLERGLIHFIYGRRKGKTTAAMDWPCVRQDRGKRC